MDKDYAARLTYDVLEALRGYIENGPYVEDYWRRVPMIKRVQDFGLYLQHLTEQDLK